MTQTLISLGHGYSARALADRLIPRGWTIHGTTRTEAKAEALRQQAYPNGDSGAAGSLTGGLVPHVFPAADGQIPPALLQAFDNATHLLISAGPDAEGDPMLRALGEVIAKSAPRLGWVGYLSTTGVYGDHQGGWVDETTPLTPSTRRGQWRVNAETQWRAMPDLPLHIFRLAGIYGPGRGPFSKVRNGTARRIIKAGQVFSRIHVDDIAQVLEASINWPNPGAIYNLCDDDPAPPQDVIAHAAELLGLPLPESVDFDQADMTPMARSFYAESKRVSNDRIKADLGVNLIHPNYREGLASLLAQETGAGPTGSQTASTPTTTSAAASTPASAPMTKAPNTGPQE